MTQNYKEFQFMFASATTHELCHAFVGYLAQNSQEGSSYTPPNVNHLDYGSGQVDSSFVQKGESGRYMEKLLFGGALEFYRDPREGHNQVWPNLALCALISTTVNVTPNNYRWAYHTFSIRMLSLFELIPNL